MRIFYLKNGRTQKVESLRAALKIEDEDKIIAFVGAGGKSTLIEALAKELCVNGKKVIITTTTHIQKPKGFFMTDVQIPQIKEYTGAGKIVIAGNDAGEGKLKALSLAAFRQLEENCDYLLVEADGARGLPIKVPAEHEPVLPVNTDLVVAVAGIDALGRSISDCCHRAELAADFLGKSLKDCVEAKDFAAIFQSKQGSRKHVVGRFISIVSKVDGDEELDKARWISKQMKKTMVAVGRAI